MFRIQVDRIAASPRINFSFSVESVSAVNFFNMILHIASSPAWCIPEKVTNTRVSVFQFQAQQKSIYLNLNFYYMNSNSQLMAFYYCETQMNCYLP